MALLKKIETNTGVSPEYWRILGVKTFNGVSAIQIEVAAYLNLGARIDNHDFISKKTFDIETKILISGENEDLRYLELPENPIVLGYEVLKRHDFFSNSEDI